jgi:hypothetical protein
MKRRNKMPRISCSVGSCSYNGKGICSAHILNIGGNKARITEATCCETYLKQGEYHNFEEQESGSTETEAILCKVETCAYHVKSHCSLNEIEVGSLEEVDHYTETDCLSFERR